MPLRYVHSNKGLYGSLVAADLLILSFHGMFCFSVSDEELEVFWDDFSLRQWPKTGPVGYNRRLGKRILDGFALQSSESM